MPPDPPSQLLPLCGSRAFRFKTHAILAALKLLIFSFFLHFAISSLNFVLIRDSRMWCEYEESEDTLRLIKDKEEQLK